MGAQGTVDLALIQIFKIRQYSGVVNFNCVHLIWAAAVCDHEDIARPPLEHGISQGQSFSG